VQKRKQEFQKKGSTSWCLAQTISATLRNPLRNGTSSVSLSAFWFDMLTHGRQKPITSSRKFGGKHTLWIGESQSNRNLDVLAPCSIFSPTPKTSATPPSDAVPTSPPPFNRSMCVILDEITSDWSTIMQEVNMPNSTASTTSPSKLSKWRGLSKQATSRTCRPRPVCRIQIVNHEIKITMV